VLAADGTLVATCADPRDAEWIVEACNGPMAEDFTALKDELDSAREERDDAERAARTAEAKLDRIEKVLEESAVVEGGGK
jgi:hypothetical protein